jgi:hypothetical protein
VFSIDFINTTEMEENDRRGFERASVVALSPHKIMTN